MDRFSVCIIGAGVIGLAIAERLSRTRFNRDSGSGGGIVLLEQEPAFGQHVSSRHSEVIHGGIYYPPDSLKAELCVRGRELLYEHCEMYQVPYRRLGKCIVASGQALPRLEALLANAEACGVGNLEYWDEAKIRRAEPALAASHALFSPATGIIDSHAYMHSLYRLATDRQVIFAPNTRVLEITRPGDGFRVATELIPTGRDFLPRLPALSAQACQLDQHTQPSRPDRHAESDQHTQPSRLGLPADPDQSGHPAQTSGTGRLAETDQSIQPGLERYSFETDVLINCAGLSAQAIAAKTESVPAASIPSLQLCKGDYFAYNRPNPFRHLIYPMPEANTIGLGIHSTQDMSGHMRFGPDSEYVEHIDYQIDPAKKQVFADAIRRYFPAIAAEDLQPAYAGIRPKLSGHDEPPADFDIQDCRSHGVEGLIQLFGIESPGLTSSLAIADKVLEILREQ